MPYALLVGLSAFTRHPLSRVHSFFRQVHWRWLHLYLRSTSAWAIAFGFAFFLAAAFLRASLCFFLASARFCFFVSGFFLTGATVLVAATDLVAGALTAVGAPAGAAVATVAVTPRGTTVSMATRTGAAARRRRDA